MGQDVRTREKRNYKVTNVKTGEVVFRYGELSDVVEATGIYPTNVNVYVDTLAIYKKQFLIELDYGSELEEEWERVCEQFRKIRRAK